ncbi:MAG: translation elongation factor Ts, partial [Clostridia bacterium]|nr:translation elongation factor Ts [Clostridia bacterium]
MAFTNKDVMELRAKTGVGMMDCKKALTESDGDMEKAVEILREKGMATSAKRAGKIASQGIVEAYINDKCGVLVEVNCESDFVARGDQYKAFVMQVAEYIANNNVDSVEQVSENMATATAEAVAKIGEKIAIRRFAKYANTGKLDSYIHMGGKIGVLVEMSGNASAELAHDICMQIAAANPSYVKVDEVPKDEIEKEKEILKAQALNEDKPKPLNIIEKMVEGRINKYY